jgi:GNAT superfamily N-acetyltransferase
MDMDTVMNTGVKLIYPPNAPELTGLAFRGFQGEADYAHILAIIMGSKEADQVERSDTLEDVARNYAHLHNCDPYQDMIFAEVEGKAVGYGRAWWEINGDGRWLGFHLIFLLPEWRGKGIGEAVLWHNEQRLRAIAEEMVKSGQLAADAPRSYEFWASDTEVEKKELLEQAGYAPIRYGFHMVRTLAEPVEITPLPEGLEVRPALPEQYRAIWDAGQEAFQDHWNFVPEPEEEFQKMLLGPDFDPSLWRVAWEGEQVAGMVLNFISAAENQEYQRKRGYTEGISVRRPWRRRGLARALLTRSLQMFKDLGYEEAALGVDAENPNGALQLYESVGFRVVKRELVYRKDF